MKVAFFTPYYLPYISGITLYPARILPLLPKTIEPTVLTFKHESSLPIHETIDGIAVERMSYSFKISKGFISVQSLLIFWKRLRCSDVFMINLPSVEGFPAVILARLLGKKVISLFHCDITLSQSFWEKILSRLIRRIVVLQLRLSAQVIAYTQDYIESLPYQHVFKNKTTYCLPPIAEHEIEPAYLDHLMSLKKDAFWVGFVGRIAREKGIEIAIEAMQKLPKTAVLVLVGPKGSEVAGEQAYYASIRANLKKSRIHYVLLPTLQEGKLAAVYRSLDVLLLPSINQTEAFGMVQAEAMLQGTPVIASDLPGVRATIKATGAGMLVKSGDSDALADALNKVASSTWSRKQISQKTRSLFSNQEVARRVSESLGTMNQ